MCNILDNKHRYELSELSDIAFLAHDRSAGVGGEQHPFITAKSAWLATQTLGLCLLGLSDQLRSFLSDFRRIHEF